MRPFLGCRDTYAGCGSGSFTQLSIYLESLIDTAVYIILLSHIKMKFCLNIVQDTVLSPHFNIVLLSLLFYMKLLCDSAKLVCLFSTIQFYRSSISEWKINIKSEQWLLVSYTRRFLLIDVHLNGLSHNISLLK